MLSHHFNSHFPWPSLAIFWAYQFSGTPILQSAEVFPHVETQWVSSICEASFDGLHLASTVSGWKNGWEVGRFVDKWILHPSWLEYNEIWWYDMVCRGIWWPIIDLIMDPNWDKNHQVGWSTPEIPTAVEHQFNRYIGKSFKKSGPFMANSHEITSPTASSSPGDVRLPHGGGLDRLHRGPVQRGRGWRGRGPGRCCGGGTMVELRGGTLWRF